MPDEKDKVQQQTPAEAEKTAKALADAKVEAERLQLDETVEGGKYKVGDEFVDADGKPVKGK